MIHKASMPVYMKSGKIVADGRTGRVDGKIEGSTRGPRGPKNPSWVDFVSFRYLNVIDDLAKPPLSM